MYLRCFTLIYFIYCIEVSSISLLFSPFVDKPFTCQISSDLQASISL